MAVLSLMAALLYSRSGMLKMLHNDVSDDLQRVNNISTASVEFAGVVRNCEDVLFNEEGGWALLSCDHGRDTWNTAIVRRCSGDRGVFSNENCSVCLEKF